MASARPGCSNGGWNADASISCSGSCRRCRSDAKTAHQRASSSVSSRYSSRHFARCSLPDDVFGSVLGCTSITSRGGRPQTSSVRWWIASRIASRSADRSWSRRRRRAHFGDDDHALLALVALHAEGDDVAGAHAVEHADGPLDVLREHVAAADDDDVLDPPAQHELAVEHVAEVAGAQPAVVEQLGRRVGALVVARRHRRAPDQQLADVALGALLERVGVDDAHLQAGHRAAEQREAAGDEREVVGIGDLDRLGDPVALEHDAVDGVAHEAAAPRRERAADGHLGHPERREHAAGAGSRTARPRRRTPRRRPGRPARRRTGPA